MFICNVSPPELALARTSKVSSESFSVIVQKAFGSSSIISKFLYIKSDPILRELFNDPLSVSFIDPLASIQFSFISSDVILHISLLFVSLTSSNPRYKCEEDSPIFAELVKGPSNLSIPSPASILSNSKSPAVTNHVSLFPDNITFSNPRYKCEEDSPISAELTNIPSERASIVSIPSEPSILSNKILSSTLNCQKSLLSLKTTL